MLRDDAMNEWDRDTPETDRDRLPELAAGQLDALSAARLRRAIAADAELADELAIIEAVRASAPAPTLDLSRIVAALPPAPRQTPVVDLAARRAERAHLTRWQWRVAATMVVLIGGAASVLWSSRPGTNAPAPVVAAADLGAGVLASAAPLEELSDAELEAMLSRLERFDGAAAADPEEIIDEEER